MSHFETVSQILIDLQHPNVTDDLIQRIAKHFETELDTLTEVEIYELIIHFCPELR